MADPITLLVVAAGGAWLLLRKKGAGIPGMMPPTDQPSILPTMSQQVGDIDPVFTTPGKVGSVGPAVTSAIASLARPVAQVSHATAPAPPPPAIPASPRIAILTRDYQVISRKTGMEPF